MKIDVEGAESMVIAGAGRLFGDRNVRPKFMMVELVPLHLARFGSTIETLLAQLADYEYAPFVLYGDRLRPLESADHGQVINTFFLDPDMRTRLSL